MICYIVGTEAFEMKAEAEAVRKECGLPPSATKKLEISGRKDLVNLINTIYQHRIAFEHETVSELEQVEHPVPGMELVWERFKSIKT